MKLHSAALVFALIVSARADVLTLRNGQCITGSWLRSDANQIQFVVGDLVRPFSRRDVSEVAFGTDATCAPAPAAPKPVKIGDTVKEVETKLGQPSELADQLPDNRKIYVYSDPRRKITFTDGKVTSIE